MDQTDPNERDEVPFPSAVGPRRIPAFVGPAPAHHFPQQPQYGMQPQQPYAPVAPQYQHAPQPQPQPQPVNGHAQHQPQQPAQVVYQPEFQSGEWEAQQVRARLATLKSAAGDGLFDLADFVLEAAGNYTQQRQQATGEPFTVRQTLDLLIDTLNVVVS